jgi:hypothetical protein
MDWGERGYVMRSRGNPEGGGVQSVDAVVIWEIGVQYLISWRDLYKVSDVSFFKG